MRDELLEPQPADEVEAATEVGLQPRRLDDFVGQAGLKEHLAIILEAARRRGQAADHLLFAGPPGLGKTSLAHIVATEMDVGLHVTSGPALEAAATSPPSSTSSARATSSSSTRSTGLSRAVEEVLYPAMEDFQLDIVLGKGQPPADPAGRPRFTLVSATRTGLITGPLRDRFGLVARLDYYDPADLEAIVERAATILEVPVNPDGCARSPGGPAACTHRQPAAPPGARLRRGGAGDGTVDHDAAKASLATFGVDEGGLDKVDRSVLRSLCERFGEQAGGAVHPRHRRRRTERDRRGRVRAVPHPRGLILRTPAGG